MIKILIIVIQKYFGEWWRGKESKIHISVLQFSWFVVQNWIQVGKPDRSSATFFNLSLTDFDDLDQSLLCLISTQLYLAQRHESLVLYIASWSQIPIVLVYFVLFQTIWVQVLYFFLKGGLF
jgi:hypothetical protein